MSKSIIYAGDLRIYSVPSALISHVEWAINQHLGDAHKFNWVRQPISPGTLALEFEWKSKNPTAAKLAIALKGWRFIRFEIREASNLNIEGVLIRCTPDLGLHQCSTGSTGDVMIAENQITNLINNAVGVEKLKSSLENAIGKAWDDELEPFRIALAEGAQDSLSKIG